MATKKSSTNTTRSREGTMLGNGRQSTRSEGGQQGDRSAQGQRQGGKTTLTQAENAGRKGDDTVGHLDSGEVVIPKQLAQTPLVRQMLEQVFEQAGIDMARYEVGNEANSVNPETGQPEFYSIDDLEEDISDTASSAADSIEEEVGDALGNDISNAAESVREEVVDPIRRKVGDTAIGTYAANAMGIPLPPGVDNRATREGAQQLASNKAIVDEAGRQIEQAMPEMPEMPGRSSPDAPGRQRQPQGGRQAQQEQRQRAALASGRSDTIRTSPLGVSGDANVRRRTLLGA